MTRSAISVCEYVPTDVYDAPEGRSLFWMMVSTISSENDSSTMVRNSVNTMPFIG